MTAVITGWLAHCRAYDRRDSWEDITHEVLINLIKAVRRGVIREPSAFINFVGTTTRRVLLDWIDRERRAAESGHRWKELYADVERGDPGLTLDLERALKDLPVELRRVVEAIYLQGHSYEEAAKLLGIPLGTLKRRLTRARKEMRKKMGKNGGSS